MVKKEFEAGPHFMNGTDPPIKSDVEGGGLSPGGHLEEDIYEDAGDLDFSCSAQEIYLTRVPKDLWKTWSQLDADEEIHLGTIRIEGDVKTPKRMSLLLSPEVAINHDVPKEYVMQVTNMAPGNTFIFTEKDLPGYGARTKASSRHVQGNGSLPFSQVTPRPGYHDRGRPGQSKVDKNKEWQPYYRRAIPKKTAIGGQVRKEMNCLAVENQEYRRLMEERSREASKARRETQLLTGLTSGHGGNLLVPGTLGGPGSFDTFIKTAGAQRGKPQESKAARMPQNDLLDLIYNCFKRYTYWSLKSLKAEVNQPEAYLKETLEKVAHLVRQGQHAMTWQLNQDFKLSSYADAQSSDVEQDKTAPDTNYSFDGASDTGEGIGSDDDDDIKLEDVIS